ncbi:MAG TPA: NAD-binding protein [Tepidisphaeraceae bacterium]|nr:NAD-binding protein [Tepidisphaeraceae bacterium]
MKRFVVIGLGNFGSTTANALHRQGHEVIVIDTDVFGAQRSKPL